MNKAYKVLFNRARGVATAVSEIASNHQARKKATAVALAVAMGLVTGSAMATTGATIEINETTPSNYSSKANIGVDGTKPGETPGQLGDSIYKIKTADSYSKSAFGISVGESNHVSATSITGGIQLKTTGSDGDAGGIYLGSNSQSASVLSSVGNISVDAGKEAYGIRTAQGTNTVNFVSGSSITAKARYYAYGMDLSGGTNTVDGLGRVSSIVENGTGTYVFGVLAKDGNNTVSFSGVDSVVSATVNCTAEYVSGITFGYLYSGGSGTGQGGSGQTSIHNLGSITAETTASDDPCVTGIYSENKNAASQSGQPATFSVAFAGTDGNGGTIKTYSATGKNYGIRFDTGSTGTSSITNVKTITAGVNGQSTSSGHAYGIEAHGGNNTVLFTPKSSITAKSSGGQAYGSWLPGGTNNIGGLTTVISEAEKMATGVCASSGNHTIAFSGSDSSISAKSSGDLAQGILYSGKPGKTTISGLGSITATRIGDTGTTKDAYGINSQNMNAATLVTDPTFSVAFDSTNGGTINSYSAAGNNYGIKFEIPVDPQVVGTSSITNVKAITAGVNGDSTSSGAAYGIQALIGVNTVSFKGSDSSITAKSSGNNAYGIAFGDTSTAAIGTTTISGLGSITATTSANNLYNVYGIYSKNGNTASESPTFSVAFDSTNGGIINSYSDSADSTGIAFGNGENCIGTSSITNVHSITAGESTSSGSATGISVGSSSTGTNTVTFDGKGSSVTAKSSSSSYGFEFMGGTNTINDLGGIIATTNNNSAYAVGIMNGDAVSTINFTGDSNNIGQAITVTNTADATKAYSIYTARTGTTTVNFENSILSGKIYQANTSVLTLNFKEGGVWTSAGDVDRGASTTLNASLADKGTIIVDGALDISKLEIAGTSGTGALIWKSGTLTTTVAAKSGVSNPSASLVVVGSGKKFDKAMTGITSYLFAVDSAAKTTPMLEITNDDLTLGTNDMVGVTLAKGAKFKKDETIKLISVTSGSLQDDNTNRTNQASDIQGDLAENNTAAAQAIAASTEASNKVNRYTFGISQVSNDLLATVTKVAASNVTKAVRQVNDSTVISFRSQMNDVSRRMGELRGNPEGYGAWARVYGGQTTMGEGMKEKSVTLQVGGDKWFSSNFYAGMMAAYTKADDTLANGDNDQKNWNIGLYGGYFGEDGRFWDATVKFGRFGNDYNLVHEDFDTSRAKYHTWGQSFSLEGGWRLQCPSTNFYVEPQAEIMYGHLNGVSFTDNLGITTSQKKVDTFVGRLGVAAGYNFADDKGTAYVKASILHDSQGKVESECRIDGEVDQDAGKSRDLGGTWGEFALGGTFKATKNLNLYGELMCTTKAAGVRTKWQGSAGVRYTF